MTAAHPFRRPLRFMSADPPGVRRFDRSSARAEGIDECASPNGEAGRCN
jgi:hypothetical protein